METSSCCPDLQWHVPLPNKPHIILTEKDVRNRVIIVGDVHGCLEEFEDLLLSCQYDPLDCTLILVGDFVNKGPYSARVVRKARELGAVCVRGNHDDTALSYALGTHVYPRKDSYSYVDSLTKEDVEWLRELPYTVTIPHLGVIIVHAGLVPGKPIPQQTRMDMVTMRNVVSVNIESGAGIGSSGDSANTGTAWEGTSVSKNGEAWAHVWSKNNYLTTDDGRPYHIYFGHDAKKGLQQHDHATGLDTGCCYGRELTAVILPEKEVVQIKARKMYVVPESD